MTNPADPGRPWWVTVLDAAGQQPSTVVALPDATAGPVRDDAGSGVGDDRGGQLPPDVSPNDILSAIYALAKELRTVSETLAQMISDLAAALAQIETKLAVVPDPAASQADLDALAKQVLIAQGLAAPPVAPVV